MMATATLTTKGQVTIPLEVRKELGLKTGDRIEFSRNPETGKFELSRKTGSIMDMRGMLKHDGPPATIEEWDQAVGDYLGEEDERIKREWSGGR